MSFLIIKVLNTSCVSLLLLLLSLSSGAQSSDDVEMSISNGGVVKTGAPTLRVTFRNLRDKEMNLYLGTIGGGGGRASSTTVRLRAPLISTSV